jgi:NAD-dependent deacetylase
MGATSGRLGRAVELAESAERICVLTGAGISTDSGIPDFRGPDGLWTRDPSAVRYVDFAAYCRDPQLRAESWRRRAAHPALQAQPNNAHRALVLMHRQGRLPLVLTQNIDGLHQLAGLPAGCVIELHGTVLSTDCLACGQRRPMSEAIARVTAGDPDPACTDCGGLLKSATVFFGQPLDQADFARAVQATMSCDLFVAIGTSLLVNPVAGLVSTAADAGVPIVIVNAQPTPYDRVAAVVVDEPIATAVPALAGLSSIDVSSVSPRIADAGS